MKKKVFIIAIVLIICAIAAAIVICNLPRKTTKEGTENSADKELIEACSSMQAFLEEDLSDDEINNIEKEIKKMKYVKKVDFISKQDALEEMKSYVEEDLLKGYEGENNIFPASFIITLSDLPSIEKAKEIEEKIAQIDGINQISSNIEAVEWLQNLDDEERQELEKFVNSYKNHSDELVEE